MQITLRVDDWGVSYMLGELGEGNKGARWTLLESGSWVSPGAWHSMCGDKRLLCDTGARSDGVGAGAGGVQQVVRQWKEERNHVCSGAFEERRREVFCSLKIGQEKGCVYRLTDQHLLRAPCGNQLRVLNLQTPTVLEGLRWAPVEQGSWELRQNCFVWLSKVAKGHSFKPLDHESELGRQQRALVKGKEGSLAALKRVRPQQGGGGKSVNTTSACSDAVARLPNGIVVLKKAGKMAPLNKAGNPRGGLSAGGSLRRDLKRGGRTLNGSGASASMSRTASRLMSENTIELAAQLRTKDKLQQAQRHEHKRENKEEGQRNGQLQGHDCTSGEHKNQRAADTKAEQRLPKGDSSQNQALEEETSMGAARPKRRKTGAPVIESEEVTRDARKVARMKKEQEKKALKQQLVTRGLCLVEIPTDGHCLFSAINDQLKRSSNASERQHTYKTLRRVAAQYMLEVLCTSLGRCVCFCCCCCAAPVPAPAALMIGSHQSCCCCCC